MSGFDNGTLAGGIFFQAKQFGSILRGSGPPVPAAGVVGDLYIDVQTFFLYNKRSAAGGDNDPWGHYLFQVPAIYQAGLKWFSTYAPADDIGAVGDYCLAWSGYPSYGMQPAIFGPKNINGTWLENSNGPIAVIDPAFAGVALPAGLFDEGPPAAYSTSTQLVAVGLIDEFIIAIPITVNGGDQITQQGSRYSAINVAVTLNPLYTAEDRHGI